MGGNQILLLYSKKCFSRTWFMVKFPDFKLYQETSYWKSKFANVPSGTKFFAICERSSERGGVKIFKKCEKLQSDSSNFQCSIPKLEDWKLEGLKLSRGGNFLLNLIPPLVPLRICKTKKKFFWKLEESDCVRISTGLEWNRRTTRAGRERPKNKFLNH
jgi:hypothetical protein